MTENEELEKIAALLRHIRHVQDNCFILGTKLIQTGKNDLGRQLIANSMIHDNSKFYGIEWKELTIVDKVTSLTSEAISQHNSTNPHHPENWNSIHDMPQVYLAEMVADWASRSAEMGGSLLDWINGSAMERYKFSKDDKVYEDIAYFVSLLIDKPFEKPKKKTKK